MINNEEKKAIDVLIAMVSNKNFCPSKTNTKINEKLIIDLAKRNKVDYCLIHFLKCKHCQIKTSKLFISKLKFLNEKRILRILNYKKELIKIEKIKKKLHKPAITYKRNSISLSLISDVDILVFQKDVVFFLKEYKKIGYKISDEIYKKEIHILNPQTNFSIDLHFLIAYPHYGIINKKELNNIKKISKQILKEQSKKKNAFSIPKELVLVSTILRYWQNDLLSGIKTLFEIIDQLKYFQDQKDIGKLFYLLKKYEILNYSLFTFELGARLFSIQIPKNVSKKIPFLIKTLSHMVSKYEISIFPDISSWHDEANSSWSKKYNSKYNFLKLILSEKIQFTRKIRPRIMLFIVLSILFSGFYHLFNFSFYNKKSSNFISN